MVEVMETLSGNRNVGNRKRSAGCSSNQPTVLPMQVPTDNYTPSTTTDVLRLIVLNANQKISLLSSPVTIHLNAGICCKR